MKKNVLIIGAGKRITGIIIPALYIMSDKYQICQVISQSQKEISLFSGRYRTITSNNYDHIDFKSIDIIIIAVTTSAVPQVLNTLKKFDTSHITLFVDTPTVKPNHISALKLFSNFKKALSSEDSIALPHYLLAKQIIKRGEIGELKHIYLFHRDYEYHAVAALKMLIGSSSLSSMKTTKYNSCSSEIALKFPGGTTATIIYPWDYDAGRFLLIGSRGVISNYELGKRSGADFYHIEHVTENGAYKGLLLNGEKVAFDAVDDLLFKKLPDDIFQKSLMDTMRIKGIIQLLEASDCAQSEFHYSPEASLYDYLSLAVSRRLGTFKDFSLKNNQASIFQRLLKITASVAP